ncbi:unnamed protein product [Ectocarpus fasciculatus]
MAKRKGKHLAREEPAARQHLEPLLPSSRHSAALAENALVVLVESGLLGPSWAKVAELQRASLFFCEVCRSCTPVRVRVTAQTPRAMWARTSRLGDGGGRDNGGGGDSSENDWRKVGTKGRKKWNGWRRQKQQKAGGSQSNAGGFSNGGGGGGGAAASASRLPRLRITSLVWAAPAKHLGDGSDLPSALRELTFDRGFNRRLVGLAWPPTLRKLTFGSSFNRELACQRRESRSGPGQPAGSTPPPPICAVGSCSGDDDGHRKGKRRENDPEIVPLLPASLEELTLGKHFNKPLPPRGMLPPGLVSLTLGRNFRQHRSVRDAVWPPTLKVVRFGEGILDEQRKKWPRLEAMRGLTPSPPTAPPGENMEGRRSFAWPAGFDRVEFWREGRVVVRLLGGTALDKDSLAWLVNNE